MATKGAKDSPKEFDSGQTQFLFRDFHSQFPTWSMMPILYDLGSSNLFIRVADRCAELCWVCFLFLFVSGNVTLYPSSYHQNIKAWKWRRNFIRDIPSYDMTWGHLGSGPPWQFTPKQIINKQTNEKRKDYLLKTVYLVISLFEGGFLCVLSFKPWSQVFRYIASVGTVGKNKTRRLSLQIEGEEQTAL